MTTNNIGLGFAIAPNDIVIAADFLIKAKTTLGRVVPDYAKALFAGTSEAGKNRVATELFTMMAQTSPLNRSRLFQGIEGLEKWFNQYIKDNEKTSLGVAIYLNDAYDAPKDRNGI